jgi:hypothetical protein
MVILIQWTYHRPKVYPIKYHGVGNQMPWKDPLGLRQHTDSWVHKTNNEKKTQNIEN